MALSEFGWANGADTWDTVTLQQFERLRAEASAERGTDTPVAAAQQPKPRPQSERPKAERRTPRRRPPAAAGS